MKCEQKQRIIFLCCSGIIVHYTWSCVLMKLGVHIVHTNFVVVNNDCSLVEKFFC